VAVNAFEILGKDVITSDGRNVGTVADVAIDSKQWAVRDFRVSIDKRIAEEMGLDRKATGGIFILKTGSIKSIGDLIMLNQSMRSLAELASTARKAGDAEPFD
jgi:sporulation protein YlmC with PRC-barrel domain